jgi:hypothetical protein
VVPLSHKDPEAWSASETSVVLETPRYNGISSPLINPSAPLPGIAGVLAARGIPGCQGEAGADSERTDGAGEVIRPGPARD